SGNTNHDGDTETGATTGRDYPRINVYNALKMVAPRSTTVDHVVGVSASVSDIAYDQSGVLHLAYYDAAAHTIRYATRDENGLWSSAAIIDTSSADVGAYLSIAIDQTGKPGIAYFDSTNANL